MVQIEWKGELAFEATPDSGHKIVMDGYTDDHEPEAGPTPLETFLMGLGACSAMDVISILEKKRQKVTGYRILVDGDRGPQGEYPRPFTTIRVRHVVEGENIDPAALARAVELSETKYCSVLATIRHNPMIETSWEVAQMAK